MHGCRPLAQVLAVSVRWSAGDLASGVPAGSAEVVWALEVLGSVGAVVEVEGLHHSAGAR